MLIDIPSCGRNCWNYFSEKLWFVLNYATLQLYTVLSVVFSCDG